jgi:hypothetical protein
MLALGATTSRYSKTGTPLLSRLNAKPPERLVVVISIRFLGDVELGTVCSQNSRPRMGGAAFTLAELDLEKITGGVALLTSG